MTTPSLIIFDCDGVLIDSEVLQHQSLVDSLAPYGIQMTLEEALKRYVGRREEFSNAEAKEQYGIDLPPDFTKIRRQKRDQVFRSKLKALPGVFNLLDELEKQRIRICIATGASHPKLQLSLTIVNLWDRFAPHLFSSTQVANGKPAPDIFLFAAAHMQTPPEECLVIEDSIPGIQAARAAGMRVFGFTGGTHCRNGHAETLLQHGAEKVFGHMNEITAALST